MIFNLFPSLATGGEARSADQATWETRAGGHQPGPAGCQRVAQSPSHERDYCELTATFMSVCVGVWTKNICSRESSWNKQEYLIGQHSVLGNKICQV